MDLIRDLLPQGKLMATSARMSLRPWINRAGIVIRGKAYSTVGREYLNDIIDDDHPDQTYRKAAQVAISTTVLIKSLYVAEHLGKKVVYYFQNDVAVSDFSSDRAVPMMESSIYLHSRTRDTNRVGLRQIGPGSLYFRGMQSKGKVKSIDCDMVVLDELDECKDSNIEFATDRLMASDLQWVAALSQPSVPGFGIDKRFQETDQRFWNLICPKCGTRNCLERNWPDNFIEVTLKRRKTFPDGATHYIACKKCGTELNPAYGEWIATYPGKLKRGYHLSQLYTQIKSREHPNVATKIMADFETKRRSQAGMENFTISYLGFPFSGGNARVHDKLLNYMEGLSDPTYEFSLREFGGFMGVDQGDTLSIVIGIMSGQAFKLVYCEETEDWGRLDMLMDRFGIYHCTIDAQPNKHSAKTFAAKYPGRVAIQYFGSKELKQGKELHDGKIEVDTVSIDRTASLDSTIDRMEMGQIHLPSREKCEGQALSNLEDLRRHLKQLISKQEVTPQGLMKKTYLSGPGIENHYGMALNSAVLSAYELGLGNPGPTVVPIFRTLRGSY